ncbi:methyltransferase type 11 [bacterium SCGC AG-212-C10]|nr:methyltransferase type 11 [bacterium SCGC AG-212-C10]
MNKRHLEGCASEEWASVVREHIIPGLLKDVVLGDDVLEVGPGPGRTTEILKEMAAQITAVELDVDLAAQLTARMAGTNVTVVNADATDMPFDCGRFDTALSFTMLHHVPSPELQDQLMAEVARVLRPGGTFLGVDSLDSPAFREVHEDDICVIVPPDELPARLERAGFTDVSVSLNPYQFSFRATKPAS